MIIDHISQLLNKEITNHDKKVLEEFPNEQFLMVQERSWFIDMANYKVVIIILGELK